MRLFACEHDDDRVWQAVQEIAPDLRVTPKWAKTSRAEDPEGRYREGLRALRKRKTDIVIAGAQVALSEFLRIAFEEFAASRSKQLLFSAAPIETAGFQFLLVDPCVVLDPSPEELAVMARGAVDLYRAIYARNDPFVAVLSHATGSYSHHHDLLAAKTVAILKNVPGLLLTDFVVQVDAALSLEAARRKAAPFSQRPNILVCTGIGVANAMYKTMEVFCRGTVRLSGSILLGLAHGAVGLLPRTCEVDEISRLIEFCARTVRGRHTP